MQQINIRQAKAGDVSGIVKLYLGWQEYKEVLPDELIAPEKEEDLLPYIIDGKMGRLYLVVVNEEQSLIGVCYLDLGFEAFQVIRIGDFIIEENYRGKGVGKQIIDYIKKYCQERGVKKLWLWTQEELTGAINFYKKNDFEIEGKQKSQFLGKDALLMGLVID